MGHGTPLHCIVHWLKLDKANIIFLPHLVILKKSAYEGWLAYASSFSFQLLYNGQGVGWEQSESYCLLLLPKYGFQFHQFPKQGKCFLIAYLAMIWVYNIIN